MRIAGRTMPLGMTPPALEHHLQASHSLIEIHAASLRALQVVAKAEAVRALIG